MTAKSVLMRPQSLRPRARAPHLPPAPCYATGCTLRLNCVMAEKLAVAGFIIFFCSRWCYPTPSEMKGVAKRNLTLVRTDYSSVLSLAWPEILIGRDPNWKKFVTLFWWRFSMT